jgi:hypothetical protein
MQIKKLSTLIFFLVVLISNPVGAINNRDDISWMNMGARQTAMGNAFTSAADDLMATFYNPAGLANVQKFQAHVQSTKALGEIDQSVVGLGVPLARGVGVGFGYVSNALNDVWMGATPATLTTGIYSSQVYILGLGINFDPQYTNEFLGGLSLGVSFKNFVETATGGSAFVGNGWDMDLGLRGNLAPDLILGLSAKNMMASNGRDVLGSFSYGNGTIENIVASYHAGLSGLLYRKQLILSAELVFYENDIYPMLLRFGGEWRWQSWLALRGGYSQAPRPASNFNPNAGGDSRLSLGIGLFQGDFSFDYAYNAGYANVDTTQHFFSITYGNNSMSSETPNARAQDQAPAVVSTQNISNIREPKPYAVYFQDQLFVKGFSKEASAIVINGIRYAITPQSDFSLAIPLPMGRNNMQIEMGGEKIIRPVLRLAHANELQQNGLQDDLSYLMTLAPAERDALYTRALTYEELAHLIVVLKDIKIPNTLSNTFSDVDLMFLKGYFDESNRGEKAVTRLALAQIIARMEGARDVSDGQAAIQFLMSSRKYRANDFSETLELLSKCSAGEQRLKSLLEGFSVPLLSRGDAILQGGTQQSIFVKFPVDAHVQELSSEAFSQKVIFTRLNNRFWSGLVMVPQSIPQGTVPFVLRVVDDFGNVQNYDLQLLIASRGQSSPYATQIEKPLSGSVPIFVKLTPAAIAQGASAQLMVGHSESLKIVSVQGLMDNRYSIALVGTDPNIWMGQVFVPPNMAVGMHNVQVTLQDQSGFNRVKNLSFEVTPGNGTGYVSSTSSQSAYRTNRQTGQANYAPTQYALNDKPSDNTPQQMVAPESLISATQAKNLMPETNRPFQYDALSTGEIFLIKANPRKVEQGSELHVGVGFPQGGQVKKSVITFSQDKKFEMKQVSNILHTAQFYIAKDFPLGQYKMDVEIIENNDNVVKREIVYEVIVPKPKPKPIIKKTTPNKKPNVKEKSSGIQYAPSKGIKKINQAKAVDNQTNQSITPNVSGKTSNGAVYMPSLFKLYEPQVQFSSKVVAPGKKLYIKLAVKQPLAAVTAQFGQNKAVGLAKQNQVYQTALLIPANTKKGVHGLRVSMRNAENQYFFFEQEILVK